MHTFLFARLLFAAKSLIAEDALQQQQHCLALSLLQQHSAFTVRAKIRSFGPLPPPVSLSAPGSLLLQQAAAAALRPAPLYFYSAHTA